MQVQLGDLELRIGNAENAATVFGEALASCIAYWGERHPNTLAVMKKYAFAQHRAGECDEAADTMKQVQRGQTAQLAPMRRARRDVRTTPSDVTPLVAPRRAA